MSELLKKLSDEVKGKISEVTASAEFKTLVDATKAATDSGSFEVIISTADIDRQGESVNQAGWELDRYLKNPIVLWGHDYYSLPIGICESIELNDGNLIARGRFAPEEANPFAQQVRRLYDLKIVRATSVGFIAKEVEGHIITKAELLEFSFVPVPANPYALRLNQVKELGLDLEMLATKGLKLDTSEEEKPDEPVADEQPKAMGDECEMDDGEMGTMQDDGNGGMVCKPKAVEEPAPEKTPEEVEAENTDKIISEYYAKAEHKNKDAQQIGIILAQLQNVIDEALMIASKLILDIIQTEYAHSVAGKTEIAELAKSNQAIEAIKGKIADLEKILGIGKAEESPEDGGAPEQRSEDGQAVSIKELNDFLMVRELVASVNRATNETLEKLNKKISEGYKSRKLK